MTVPNGWSRRIGTDRSVLRPLGTVWLPPTARRLHLRERSVLWVLHCPPIVAIGSGYGRLGVCVGSAGGVGSCEESEYGGLEQPAGVAGPWAAVQSPHGASRGVESRDRVAVCVDDPC